MNTIQSKWDDFRIRAIHPKAGDNQLIEIRRAFFAGAAAIMGIHKDLAERNVSDQAACAVVAGLCDELNAFAAQVGRHRA
ncbi:MAG: hypothetical protein KDG50_10190 [Chromatiales bacterium]|nr:hypothetical protein [Chromatiales bacterium]